VVYVYGAGVLSGCKGGSLGCEGVPGSPNLTRPQGPQMHELALRNGAVSRLVLPAGTAGAAKGAGAAGATGLKGERGRGKGAQGE